MGLHDYNSLIFLVSMGLCMGLCLVYSNLGLAEHHAVNIKSNDSTARRAKKLWDYFSKFTTISKNDYSKAKSMSGFSQVCLNRIKYSGQNSHIGSLSI